MEDLCAWAAENATVWADTTASKEEWIRMLSAKTSAVDWDGNVVDD
jgi:hypothetical protein